MIRAFQWDLARQVERLEWLLRQLPRYADWGYEELYLHLEDAVEYPSLPTVARADAYRHKDLLRLVRAASDVGIKTVPIVNLLGHTQYLIKTPELRDLNELRAEDGTALDRGQICPVHPRTIEVAKKLLRDVAPFCTAGKVHLGLDESFHLGRHPRSQREIKRIGLAGHFARYVTKLHRLTQAAGLEMGMWGDMFYFLPDAIRQLPRGITVYEWYYHAFKRHPRVELFNFAEFDLTTPLRAQGIDRFGCPMNGAFRFEPLPHFGDRIGNIMAWWQHGQRTGAKGFLVSSWEPYRLAIELTTAIDAAAATLWLQPGITDPREMLAEGFARVFGRRGRAAARLALAADRYPYSGYPRWEIDSRWDTLSPREPLATYHKEQTFFRALTKTAHRQKAPAALRASLEFREYLATRDVQIRTLARKVLRAKKGASARQGALGQVPQVEGFMRDLRSGERAARTMWQRTRDSKVIGPNESMVRADRRRFVAALRGSRVFGDRWHLCYSVHNFAPAVQLVGVEQQQSDGTWALLQSCYTIEFRSVAAHPTGTITREHAAALLRSDEAEFTPTLRVFVEKAGCVKLGNIELVNGRIRLPAEQTQRRKWVLLGHPPVRAGWPDLTRRAELNLTFRGMK